MYPQNSGPYYRDTYSCIIIATPVTIAKKWKQPICPSVDEWIMKMWYSYTIGSYSAIKRKEIYS